MRRLLAVLAVIAVLAILGSLGTRYSMLPYSSAAATSPITQPRAVRVVQPPLTLEELSEPADGSTSGSSSQTRPDGSGTTGFSLLDVDGRPVMVRAYGVELSALSCRLVPDGSTPARTDLVLLAGWSSVGPDGSVDDAGQRVWIACSSTTTPDQEATDTNR